MECYKGSTTFSPENDDNALDPIALKKLLKEEGKWLVEKEILGFIYDGVIRKLSGWRTPSVTPTQSIEGMAPSKPRGAAARGSIR